MPVKDYSGIVFNRQFLLSKAECKAFEWPYINISSYHLYTHPNLELTISTHNHIELYLLGYCFDYRYPTRTNQEILQILSLTESFGELITELDEMSGRFILIRKSIHELQLMHDAEGQREIYYDDTFSAFGSQPKIIEHVVPGVPQTDPDAIDFFSSRRFLQRKIFVGDATHRKNIRHLRPNHYIDISAKVVKRFFPLEPVKKIPTEESAAIGVRMLKGYLAAAAHRFELRMGVTAGYDSRLLFLSSLDLQCKYQVSEVDETDNDIDIAIAGRVVSSYGRTLHVSRPSRVPSEEEKKVQDLSIDFPRFRVLHDVAAKSVLINGNGSEVARCQYGNLKHITVRDLLFSSKYQGDVFVRRVFQKWLDDNKGLFIKNGYHVLDMFYWEERVANWVAKGKTESALSSEIYSPFSSRKLLTVLLGTPRKHRDRVQNKLYRLMIGMISPEALQIPINPTRENRKIIFLKKLGLYHWMKYGGQQLRYFKELIHVG